MFPSYPPSHPGHSPTHPGHSPSHPRPPPSYHASCPSSSLPSSIQPASSTQRTVSYILPGSSTQPTVSYILPGSPPPLSPPSPFPSSYLGTVTAPASRPHLSSHLIGPPSEPLPPASPASQAFKHRFSFQKLAAPEPSKAARQSPPLALRTADLAAVDQRDPRTVTKALERAIQQRLEERARGESAQARAKDDVRSLVERLLSGRPPPNEERSSILSACVQACELGGLNLSTVLQELTIDGCPPIYWAIVNRAAASGSDNVELDSIVFALLDACRPLRPVTLDAIRRACMRASDNVLLQRLFLDIPLLSPLSAGDMILLGKNLKDHVDVDEKRDGTGSFVAYIKIPKFPLRMRLCHSVTIQFVASCRLWILRFNAVVETAATKGQPESKWYLSLELGQNSPPTTVNASLIAGPSNPAENRGPDPARTVSFGCNTPELSPGRLLRVRLDECPIGPHLLSGSSLFVGSNKTFHAELSQSQRPQLLADTLITSVSSSPQLVIPTPELLQSLPLPPTPKKKRSSPPHTTLRRGGRIVDHGIWTTAPTLSSGSRTAPKATAPCLPLNSRGATGGSTKWSVAGTSDTSPSTSTPLSTGEGNEVTQSESVTLTNPDSGDSRLPPPPSKTVLVFPIPVAPEENYRANHYSRKPGVPPPSTPMFSAAESNTASSVDGYQGSRTRSSWASVPTVSPGLSPPPDLAPPPSLPPSPDLPPPWDLSSLSCLQPPPGAPFSSHESCPYDHAGRGPRFSSIISSPDGQQIFSIDGDDIKHATTGTIDGNMSTSVSEHDSQRENTLHPEKGSTPYITANEAYTHALRMETPLQDALAIIGFSGEYILQVGFNPIALQEGLLIEEIYLSLNGDLPFLNDQLEHETFASIFTPFPGVVCTKEHVYYLPVDPLAHGYPHLSSLGGFKVRTANNSASASASASASGGGSPGSDESGNGDLRGKGKSREDRPGAEGGGEGGKDEGDDASDVSGKPGGGDSTPDPGFHITLKSMLSIKTGSTVSHDVTTRVNAAVMFDASVPDHWPGPKIGVDMSEVTVSSETHCETQGTLAGQPAYVLSLAEVYMTGCSTEEIVLVGATPDGVFAGGDSKKRTANKGSSINIGAGFVAPNGPTLMAGFTNGKGRGAEETVGRWDISFHSLTSNVRRAHLTDQTYSSVDGGSWKFVPNTEDFGRVTAAKFKDDLSPSGIFHMWKRAPTKLEIKIMSCWETQPAGSANRWNTLFKTMLRRPAAEPIPAFANFICAVSTAIHMEKVPDKDIYVLFEKNFEGELLEEPQRFKTVKKLVEYENLEVPMLSAIMGRTSLSKAVHRHQGNILP